jgi:hypothetical protein
VPLAVSVAEPPLQIVDGLAVTVTVGFALTVKMTEPVPVQPAAFVTVTL